MTRILVLWPMALACILAGVPAKAGPWPRDAGSVFVSIGQSTGQWGETQAYVEYGAAKRLTMIGELAHGKAGMRTLASVQYALAPGKRGAQAALALGVVITSTALAKRDARLRVGLSWGKGFSGRLPGWMALDATADLGRTAVTTKSTTTLGLKPRPGWMTILQVQTETEAGALRIHGATSVVWDVRKGLSLELGLRQGIVGTRSRQVKLGSWVTF
ncbi:MAG: hypothetical protein Q7J57_06475 [Gemmobacter sp.]|nr:hypothetical protein [Gemmobacter sp.]